MLRAFPERLVIKRLHLFVSRALYVYENVLVIQMQAKVQMLMVFGSIEYSIT